MPIGIELIFPGVDIGEPVGHHAVQTRGSVAEVEPAQPGGGGFLALGDLVEIVFHAGRERVVDQIGEMPFEKGHLGEGRERRNEG